MNEVEEAEKVRELSGPEKAAIFMLGVGEAEAATLLKHMNPQEVQSIGEAMAEIESVTSSNFARVAEEFTETMTGMDPHGVGAKDFVRKVMNEALGESRATTMLNKVMSQPDPADSLEPLKWMPPEAILRIMSGEHPQIQAVILSILYPEQAAETLRRLPENQRSELIARLATLKAVDANATKELEEIISEKISGQDLNAPLNINGLNLAASILNKMEGEEEQNILKGIAEKDEGLVAQIGDLMFIFDDLAKLDDRGMQRLLREISSDLLSKALKGAQDNLKDKFLNNMSSRAADMLREDMEVMGPIKLSDVTAAQKEIITEAMKLAEDDQIVLGNKGGDDFV